MLLKSVMKCPGAPLRGSFLVFFCEILLPKRKWKKWRDVRFFMH